MDLLGGSDAESLMRGWQVAPSCMVPQPPQEDVIPSPLLSVSIASGSSVSVPGPLPPSLGQVSAPVDWMHDQSRVRGATGIKFDNVSAPVANVSFAPSFLLLLFLTLLLFSSLLLIRGFPPVTFLVFLPLLLLLLLCHFPFLLLLPFRLSLRLLLPFLFLFSLFLLWFLLFYPLRLFPLSLLLLPLFLRFPFLILLRILILFLCLLHLFLLLGLLFLGSRLLLLFLSPPLLLGLPFRLPLLGRSLPLLLFLLWAPPPGFTSVASPLSSFGDFAECQARVLGLSAEYQASGGSDFPAYLSAHFPHLYSDFRLDFSSGSSRFLSALASSASLPPPSSSSSVSAFSSAPPPFSAAPLTPSVRPSSALSSAPVFGVPSAPPVSLSPVFSSAPLHFPAWGAVPGGSGVAPVASSVTASFPVPPPVSSASSSSSLFCPFAVDSSASVSSAPVPSALSSPFAYPGPSSSASAPFAPPPSFAPPDDLPGDMAPDALPRDVDPSAAVPDSARSEFRRMLSFIVDLFLQAAGSPSAPPPPRALFEDFFGSSAPSSAPVFLNWFERVRTALTDADSRMASFLATGRGDFSFLHPRNASYAVRGEFAA